MKLAHLTFWSFLVLFSGKLWAEEFLVIVHPDSSIKEADADSIKRLYLGKTSQLLGVRLTPADLPEGNSVRDAFYEKVVDKDASQLKAYWAQLIFTGGGSPPTVQNSDQTMVQWVLAKQNSIGYVSSSANTSNVKVIYRGSQ
ncbi:MAG TPA: phosphate ABC transporter substrate-binding protein [Gammaproteobacteria bacterium]|nr:phosphate ABC transporter substrate-binding protein [Gammaproteobacteria bacterium]